MIHTCFQLKGSVVTTFILELYQFSFDVFSQQLKEKISQAPAFFAQSPIVIDLDKIDDTVTQLDLNELLRVCREFGLQPMAFKCTDPRFIDAVKSTGLTLLSDTATRASSKQAVAPASEPVTVCPEPTTKSATHKSMIITRPVRSGQQVYAEGGDLIILSQVSEGAEVLADGNIHVYGNLRGRALAGVRGDTAARVFCKKLEAELVSIAGTFMLSDALREKVWGLPAQVFLDELILQVEAV